MGISAKLIDCVKRFQDGDTTAFEEVYSLSYPYLHTCVIHVVKDDDATQDMIQETYLEICRNIGQLEKPENFLGWASTIANRKSYAFLKKKNAEQLVYENKWDNQEIQENTAENEEFIPEGLMENKDKQRMLMEIIDGLTDMQRLCVIGYYYSELSQEEIANALDIPVNTVKSHLNRAKAKIKEAVVELDEKKGIKLYSLAPLILLLLGTEAEACSAPDMSDELVRELGIDSIGKSRAGAIGKTGGKLAAAKLYGIAAVVGLIAIAGIAGIVISHRSVEDSEETVQAQQDAGVQEADLQQNAETQETAAEQSETDMQDETQEQDESELRELLVSIDVYDSYGNAYGGSIPVKKDGLWGAINYDNEVIVPFEYDGFYASGDKLGNFILYKSTVTEETYDLSELGLGTNTVTYETRVYYLFDNQGNILYQGEDEVRASGGMYITLTENAEDYAARITYHSLDGTELVSELCEPENARINGFYDGISNFYCSYGTEIYVNMDGADGFGPFEDDVIPRIAAVDLQGILSWQDDPYYYLWWDRINASIEESMAREARNSSLASGSGTGDSSFFGRTPLSTMNHGYYVTGSEYIEPGYMSVYSEEGDNIANIDCFHLSVDGNDVVTNNSGIFNEDNYYRGYYVDGVTFYNYGSNMVFMVDDKNILVDFSKNSNPGNETEDLNMSEVVTAVYDYIAMADEEYWLVRSGEQWGYIDHDGNEAAMFDDAGGFSNGYAVVLEGGEAWLIDTDFNKLEDLGAADSVATMGELFSVTVGDEKHIYQY